MHLSSSLEDSVLARQQNSRFSAPAQTDSTPASDVRVLGLSSNGNRPEFLDIGREVKDFGKESFLGRLLLWTT